VGEDQDPEDVRAAPAAPGDRPADEAEAADFGDEPDPADFADPTTPAPRPAPRPGWKRRTASGALLSGLALGFQQVFEEKRDEPSIMMETSGTPPEDLAVEGTLDGLSPRRSVVKIRPWLLDRSTGAPAGAPAGGPDTSHPDTSHPAPEE
jgi:hypothetical protein